MTAHSISIGPISFLREHSSKCPPLDHTQARRRAVLHQLRYQLYSVEGRAVQLIFNDI